MTLLVDSINIATYGAFVTDGGLNGLLSFPSLKEPEKNDWPELDGIEVDLSAPVLDKMEFQMNMASTGNLDSFINLIKTGYHTFSAPELGVSKSLRFVSVNDYKGNVMKMFSIALCEDTPLSGYSYQAPTSSVLSTGLLIDGNDIKNYGIVVLEGSKAEIDKKPALKQNLLIESRYLNGAVYDAGVSKYQAKEVKLNLCFTDWSFAKQNALLYDLIRPGERTLTFNGVNYKFYYKSASVKRFSAPRWMEFELNLVFV